MVNYIHSLLNRFFSERTVSMHVKLMLFSATLFFSIVLASYLSQNHFSREEARLTLYAFHVIIFLNSFFCGFWPGIITATLSGWLAIHALGQGWSGFRNITLVEIEIFLFVVLFFLLAITVELLRENIEKLKVQLEENRRLYEQATHMETLALAGEIAAGIAHEIRNPLTVVQGYIQLLSNKQLGSGDIDSFELLLAELKRTNLIISDFLRLSRPSLLQKTPLQINQVIESACSLMSAESLRIGVNIKTSLADNLPLLCLDQNQMLQVFINLVSNALHAMPEGGDLTITTCFNRFNNVIMIKVKDSGIGIPKDSLQRIFTPFFTTREQGTGLGLSISHTIILAHSGQIAVTSTANEGTEFTITFPRPVLTLDKRTMECS